MTSIGNNPASRSNKRSLLCKAWLPLTLCLIGAGLSSAIAQTTTTLALTGNASPDGNGTFSGFQPALVVNANGKVAFIADLTGTQNSSDTHGIFIADTNSITKLVRTGDATPDGNGAFRYFSREYGVTERLVLNDNDSVAFMASLSGTSGGPADNLGLFGASAGGGVKQFVRTSDAAPDGNGVFAPFESAAPFTHHGLDNAGTAMFHGMLSNTSGGEYVDDSGAFSSNGTSFTQLIRGGETAPGGSEALEFIEPGIASNLNGQLAAAASIAFDFHEGPPGDDLNRIYVSTGGVLKEVFRTGVSIPDGNGIVNNIQELSINSIGNVMFIGGVSGSDDWRLDVPRLFITDGVTLTQIVRQGGLGPGEDEFRVEYFTGRDFNSHNKVVFSMTLHRNAAPPDNQSSGIYLANGSNITTVLHQGDPVPGGNGTFGNIAVPVFLNNKGQITFSAPLDGTADQVSDIRGIFFIGSDGVVQTVARHGMPLAGSTIYSASSLGDLVDLWGGPLAQFQLSKSDLYQAGMTAINDSGQVPFWASLADGRSGIFLWNSSTEPPDDDVVYADGFE